MNFILIFLFISIFSLLGYLIYLSTNQVFDNKLLTQLSQQNLLKDYYTFSTVWSDPVLYSPINTITKFDASIYTFLNSLNINTIYNVSNNTICSDNTICYSDYLNNICYDSDQLPILINKKTCNDDNCIDIFGKKFTSKQDDIYPDICNISLNNCPKQCNGQIGYLTFDFDLTTNNYNVLSYDTSSFSTNKFTKDIIKDKDTKEKYVFRIIRYSYTSNNDTNIYNNLVQDDDGKYAVIIHRKTNKILDTDGTNLILSTFTNTNSDIKWYLQTPQLFSPGFLDEDDQRCKLDPTIAVKPNQNMLISDFKNPLTCPTTFNLSTLPKLVFKSSVDGGNISSIPPDFTTITDIDQSVIDGTVTWSSYNQFNNNLVLDDNNIYKYTSNYKNYINVNCPQQIVYVSKDDITNIADKDIKTYLIKQNITKITDITFKSIQIVNKGDLPTLKTFIPFDKINIVLSSPVKNINYTQFIPVSIINIYLNMNDDTSNNDVAVF